jgi:hypothetical protein
MNGNFPISIGYDETTIIILNRLFKIAMMQRFSFIFLDGNAQ